MTKILNATVKSVLAPFNPFTAAQACPPDCGYEHACGTDGIYYRRECCYRPDCVYYCTQWVQIGTC